MGIKRTIYILISITFLAFFMWSCKSNKGDSYCYGCQTTEPDTAELILTVSLNEENQSVPIEIYEGKYKPENTGTPIHIDTAKNGKFKIYVPTNKTYSAVAIYKNGNRYVKAVDGSIFNREEQTGCEITCWQLYGGELDLRLKDY